MRIGKAGSLIEAVEAIDANPCLDKLATLADLNKPLILNSAFVFIKHEAVTDRKMCSQLFALAEGTEAMSFLFAEYLAFGVGYRIRGGLSHDHPRLTA